MSAVLLLIGVKRSRITDPVAFTLALQARVEMGNADRVVPLPALLRSLPFRAQVDPPLSPAFFRVLHRITHPPVVPS